MGNVKIDFSEFSIILHPEAHQIAQGFWKKHREPKIAKQVYLNTLSVLAIDCYLQEQGIPTDLAESGSWQPLQQTLMNVADLVLSRQIKVECIPVLPGQSVMEIPGEVWTDRVAYIAVRLNQELTEAKILGFVTSVTEESEGRISLQQLRSPTELVEYLQSVLKHPVYRLLDQLFKQGWQQLEAILPSHFFAAADSEFTDFAFRSQPRADRGRDATLSPEAPNTRAAKIINFGEPHPQQQVALVVGLVPQDSHLETDVYVSVYPLQPHGHLPENLELKVLDGAGSAVMQALARRTETLQLEFIAEAGETFSIKIALGTISVTEAFSL